MKLTRLAAAAVLALGFCLPAEAQVAFRSAASAGVASAGDIAYIGSGAADVQNGCGTANPPIPGGAAAGDVLIAVIEAGASPTITATGWTQLFQVNPNGNHTAAVYWRVATGGDPNAITQSGTCNVLIAQVSAFRGVDTLQPFETAPLPGGNLVSQNAGNVDTGTQTTTLANAMLVVTAHVTDNRTTAAPAGFSEAFDSTTGTGNDVGISLKYQLQTTAGAKGPFNNMDLSGGGNDWNTGALFALRPAGLRINVPVGTALDDVMVASIAVRPETIAINAPAGWTLVRDTQQPAGTASRMATYYRLATGGEPASYVWTFSGGAATGAAGGIASFSGVDTSAPIDAEGGNVTPGGIDHTANGITTTLPGTMLVGSFEYTSVPSDWTAPTGMTEALDQGSVAAPDGAGIKLHMAYEVFAGFGATGNRTATSTNDAGADTGVAHLLALRGVVPVLHFAMDETGWNGTAGETLDSSGAGLHGRGANGATTSALVPVVAGSPGTCRYGVFDGTDDHVETADHPLLDVTDELTVLAWIRPTALPGGGGLKTIFSKDQNYEVHVNPAGQIFWWWGGGALQLTSTGTVALNAWQHVAIVYSRSGAFQRIYINGVQDPSTNNQVGQLVPNNLPFQVAADQGFAGRNFAGLVDEVYVFRQALSAARISQYMNATRPCPAAIDHFSISHAGSGVACLDATITIVAHDSTHTAVDANGITVNLSTTNGQGTWTGVVSGGGVLTDAVPGDGAATYTFPGGATTAELSFRYANLAAPSELFGFNVSGGGFSESTGTASGSDDPSFTMAQAGFRFRNVTDGNTTITTQIAGKPSDTGYEARTFRLQAIRTDTQTGSCTGLFASQVRAVELGAECNAPATCAGLQVAINGDSVTTGADNGGAGASAYTSVNLSFDANSEADTVLQYPDAGQVSLHARYDLDAGVAGYEMVGSSNAYVVRPFGFAFRGANAATPIQHGTTAAAGVLAAAGDNFTMTLAAYRWAPGQDTDLPLDGWPDLQPADAVDITGNGLTPNFAADVTVVSGANLPGIAGGAVSRAGGGAILTALEWSGGAATVNDWRYSEAGNVLLAAFHVNYLGSGATILGLSSYDGTTVAAGHVGRFIPKHFALAPAPVPTLGNRAALACGASPFSYMGEGLTLGFRLEARNAQDVLTQNYTGPYAKLDLSSGTSLGIGARSGATGLTPRVDAGASVSGSFVNGVADLVATAAIRRASPDAPDGPYANVAFGVAPLDSDGVAIGAPDFDADVSGSNERATLGVSTEVRFGRLRMQNALGSGKTILPVGIETQYWSGGAFVRNADDDCTSIPRSAMALGAYVGALAPAPNCKTFIQQDPIAFTDGAGALTLTAPAGGSTGSVLLTPNLGTGGGSYCQNAASAPVAATAAAGLQYLLGRWNDADDPDASGATSYDDKPSSRAAFGLYGSQPGNFIYFRENF